MNDDALVPSNVGRMGWVLLGAMVSVTKGVRGFVVGKSLVTEIGNDCVVMGITDVVGMSLFCEKTRVSKSGMGGCEIPLSVVSYIRRR